MRWSLCSPIVALAVALAAGCGKREQEKVPSCAELTEHLYEVTRIAYPGHGDMEMGNRKAEIEACEQRNLPAAERRCMMAAKDLAGVAACRKHSAPPASKPAKPAAPAAPTSE